MSMQQSRLGCLIPLFIYPTSQFYDRIISARNNFPDVPIAVVLNPNNGPGQAVDPNYNTGVTRLKAAGVITLGYVDTNLATTPQATVESQIATWKLFYPEIDGIFFDAMSNQSANKTYYLNLNNFAKASPQNFSATVGNPRTTVPLDFFDGGTFDTIVIFEGAGLPTPSNYASFEPISNDQIAFISHGVPTLNTTWGQQISAYAGWIYMTSDGPPLPWDTLPGYFEDFIKFLDNKGGGVVAPEDVKDKFGIQKVYHTKTGGEEWFVDMNNPTKDERLQNEPSMRKLSDGSWRLVPPRNGDIVLEVWSPAYSDTEQRKNARWLNVEITGYVQLEDDPSGSYSMQIFTRGGHHTSSARCEGSAYKARFFRDGKVGVVKEVCHEALTKNAAVVSSSQGIPGGPEYKWLGLKFIVYNVLSPGGTNVKLEVYADKKVHSNYGNLRIANNWVKITEYTDVGGWFADKDDFDDDCDGCGYTRDQKLTTPGGNTRYGHVNRNRNLVAWETFDVKWKFKFLSAREIDPNRPAIGGATPPPPPPPPPPGETPTPTDVFDNFGVRQIYPTRSGGTEWYIDMNNPRDSPRFNTSNTISKNADGTWKCRDTSVRFNIYQPNGYNAATTGTQASNHQELAENGFMQDEADWRNVEMTGYFKINATPVDDHFQMIVRGGRQDISPQPNCEGTGYRARLYSDGKTQLMKKQWHISEVLRNQVNNIGQSLIGKWVGFKYCVHNKTIAGTTVIRHEIFVDINGDNKWIRYDETTDSGQWGAAGGTCNGADDQLILWGGPIAIFGWNTFNDTDFKWLSIREIDSDATPIAAPPEAPEAHCGSP